MGRNRARPPWTNDRLLELLEPRRLLSAALPGPYHPPWVWRDRAPAPTGTNFVQVNTRYVTPITSAALSPAPTGVTPAATLGPRQMEYLDRGVVVVRKNSTTAYISWRLLGLDPSNISFNLYRSANGGAAVKLNASPITTTTDFSDSTVNFANSNAYFVRAVVNGVEGDPSPSYLLPANVAIKLSISIPLIAPPINSLPDGSTYTYNANDASVGDVDGDGQYEVFLKWDPSNSHDNSQSGYTGDTWLDCYKLDGTRLWRIDEGMNIRSGAHYTQFMVYDFDGDGKAEVAMRTAPGTKDGLGNYVLMGSDNPNVDYRNSSGYNLTSPEYLTFFNGLTGAQIATTAYKPDRVNINQWGDTYGNRGDRFLMAVAYLDGVHPSLVLGRGIFPGQSGSVAVRNELTAWDFKNGQITMRWWFRADRNVSGLPNLNTDYIGQGTYDMIPVDLDGDGKDEIVYGAMAINDDGTPYYTTKLGHGDAMHVTDMDLSRPGEEVFMPHETPSEYVDNINGVDVSYGGELRGATGTPLVAMDGFNQDVGRGIALDIDPNHPGYEMWTSSNPNIYNVDGSVVQAKPSNMFTNFGIQWDADPLSELLDGTTISDWVISGGVGGRSNYDLDPATSGTQSAPNDTSNNGTKSTPCLAADIFGDWREEVIWRRSDNTALDIYTTAIPATSRMYTMMDDTQYREAVAWQNVGYNQPPHPSFYIGAGMPTPPTPNIFYAPTAAVLVPTVTYQAENASFGGGATVESNNLGFHGTGYINFPTTGGFLEFDNVDGGLGGNATITFRFALANNPRTGVLKVNGVSQSITFPNTGAFTTYLTQSVTVSLNPGATNTIRLESNGQDLANIDELQVSSWATQIVGTSGNDTFAFNGLANSSFGFSLNGGPSITIVPPTSAVPILGQAGDDTFTLNLAAGIPAGTLSINGVSGNDVLVIQGTPAGTTINFPAPNSRSIRW